MPAAKLNVVDPTLRALWDRVLEDWDDDARHGKLVGYAQQNSLLGDAAGLYRQASMEDGSPYRLSGAHIADAKKRLGGIAMLAVMDLDSAKAEPPSMKGVWVLRIIAGAILIIFVSLFGWALTRH